MDIHVQIIIFDKNSGIMKNIVSCILIIFILAATSCSDKSNEDAIKVMTMNVRYDNPGDSINAWPNRVSVLCDFILNEKPDIIGMQEVLWHQNEVLDSVLSEYSSVGVGRDDGARAGEMNPVYFRKDKFDFVRTLTFWFSDTPDVPGSVGWGASLPSIVTWMELVDKKSHEHFFCFNTHFADDSDSVRIMSSQILLKSVNKIAEGFPFIITGDFNMLPNTSAYEILTGPDESVPVIQDSYIISEKGPAGPSYTFNDFSDKPGYGRIDYIFVRNGMKVPEQMTLVKKQHGIYISDHWPVVARVLLK